MYYVYIYLSETGEPYYVGKGSGRRAFARHTIPIPERELVQIFYFETQQECWDTEMELITFFGRKCDGGTLDNISTGGAGTPGVIPNTNTRTKLSNAQKKRYLTKGHHLAGHVGQACANSKRYRVTCPDGTIVLVTGLNQFCHERGLSTSNLCNTATGKRPHHKGFTAEKIE